MNDPLPSELDRNFPKKEFGKLLSVQELKGTTLSIMDSLGSMDLSELYNDLSFMTCAPAKPCRNFSKLGIFNPVGTDSVASKSRTFVKIALRGLRPVEDIRKEIEAIIATLDSIRFDFSDHFSEDEESLFQMNYRHFLGTCMRDEDHEVPKKGCRFSPLSLGEEKQIIDSFERESTDSEECLRKGKESQPVTNQFSNKCARGNDARLPSRSGSHSPKSFMEFAFAEQKWDEIGDSLDSESVDSCEFSKALNQQVLDRYCRRSPKCQARRFSKHAQLSDSLDSDSVDSGEFLRTVEDIEQPGPSHCHSQQYVKDTGCHRTCQDGTFPPKKPPRLSTLEALAEEKQVIDSLDSESSDSREFMKPVEASHHPETSQFCYQKHLKETGNQVPSQARRCPAEKHVRFTTKEDKHNIDSLDIQSCGSDESLITFETLPNVSQHYSPRADEEIEQAHLPNVMSVKELRDCLKVQDLPHWDTHDRENDRFNELLKELWKMRKELDAHKNIFVNIVNQNLAIAEVVRVLHLDRGDVRWSKKKKKWKRLKGFFRRKRIARILKVTKKRLGHISRFLGDVESDLRTEGGHYD